jgi:hypothetical protein
VGSCAVDQEAVPAPPVLARLAPKLRRQLANAGVAAAEATPARPKKRRSPPPSTPVVRIGLAEGRPARCPTPDGSNGAEASVATEVADAGSDAESETADGESSDPDVFLVELPTVGSPTKARAVVVSVLMVTFREVDCDVVVL